MIEDEINPFEAGMAIRADYRAEVSQVAGTDSDLIEVVEELDSEE